MFVEKTYEKSGVITADIVRDNILRNGLYELLLDVTHSCNFRCSYCAYSGQYNDSRKHSSVNMSTRIAIKAVDLYFSYLEEGCQYNPLREPTIAFYGGEPLLNFHLIEQVVRYAQRKYSDIYDLHFTTTTNGSLLSEEIIDFLLENEFMILISLDGPKSEHDRCRVYRNGKGTFDTVIRNIERLVQRAEEFGLPNGTGRIYAMPTYDPKTDLRKVRKFFDDESPIKPIFVNPVRPYGTEYYSQFSSEEKQNFDNMIEEERKEYFTIVVGRNHHHQPNFLEQLFSVPIMMAYYRTLFAETPLTKYSGTCIPGFKMHVDTKGLIRPCERCPQSIIIGEVNHGLDWTRIAEVIAIFKKHSLANCSECPIGHSCSNCIASLGLEGALDPCLDAKSNFINNLSLAMYIHSMNPDYFQSRVEEYAKIVELIELK